LCLGSRGATREAAARFTGTRRARDVGKMREAEDAGVGRAAGRTRCPFKRPLEGKGFGRPPPSRDASSTLSGSTPQSEKGGGGEGTREASDRREAKPVFARGRRREAERASVLAARAKRSGERLARGRCLPRGCAPATRFGVKFSCGFVLGRGPGGGDTKGCCHESVGAGVRAVGDSSS
jgi:hypothetical protein